MRSMVYQLEVLWCCQLAGLHTCNSTSPDTNILWECLSRGNFDDTMRWKLTIWLGVALATAACAQIVLIDNDIHLQHTPSEQQTTTPATTLSRPSTTSQENQRDNVLIEDGNNQVTIVDNNNIDDNTGTNDIGDGSNADKPVANEDEETGSETGQVSSESDSGNSEGDANDADGSGQTNNESGEPDNENSHEEDGTVSAETGLESDENRSSSTETENGSDETPPSSNESIPNSNEQSVETIGNQNSSESQNSRSEEISREVEVDVVETESGLVQGFYLHADSGIRSYIDIPYGMFSGPFKPPIKTASWEGIHQIREHQKRCPQIDESGDYVGDIDCLTLSVFAPANVENAAVLLHIHDGQFKLGSANPNIYGPEYLVSKGVILVLPNYRLGPLGFLCMRNETAPGNAALKDLTLALDWIKTNIGAFGGNSSHITVSGDGKSGALAGYLALSPKSRDYVSGVIVESGSMLAPWAIDRDPIATVTILGDTLHQAITNEIRVELLVSSAKDVYFKPCIESGTDVFINKPPWEILQEEIVNIPFMIGSASHAGLQEAMQETVESLIQLNEDFSLILPNDLTFINGVTEKTEVGEKIKKQYFANRSVSLDETHGISLFYTDAYYLGPAIRASRLLVKAGVKVYFYEFAFVGEFNRELASMPTTVQGAARGDIVGYTFTQDGEHPHEGTEEERMVHLTSDLWVSFIQTGIPSADNVLWNELQNSSESEEEWLSLNLDAATHHGLHVDRLALWTEIYNNHFVDRNLSLRLMSSFFVVFSAIFLMSFTKVC